MHAFMCRRRVWYAIQGSEQASASTCAGGAVLCHKVPDCPIRKRASHPLIGLPLLTHLLTANCSLLTVYACCIFYLSSPLLFRLNVDKTEMHPNTSAAASCYHRRATTS